MKVNIAKPIKDAAKNMVKFYFDTYHKDSSLDGIKRDILRHIEDCEIDAFATRSGSNVKIKQKCKNRYADSSRN